MRKFIHPTAFLLAATAMFIIAGPALAEPDRRILEAACTWLETLQTWIFGVSYVLGAIGLVIIAVSAFLGRFKFSHLIALGGGLFIVAMADALISFVTLSQGGTDSCV